VDTLVVRELRGVGIMFTPKLDALMNFHGLVYKPAGEYQANYQIVTGPLLNEPRVSRSAKIISFAPTFSWSNHEVVLTPFKLTTFGRLVLDALHKLNHRFPSYKAFVVWDASRRRHVVHYDDLTPQEQAVIDGVTWPGEAAILEALTPIAYDNLDDLAAANDDIRALIRFTEVE
jgi:hypothetical protein